MGNGVLTRRANECGGVFEVDDGITDVVEPKLLILWKWSRYSTHYLLGDGSRDSSHNDLVVKGIKTKNISNTVF